MMWGIGKQKHRREDNLRIMLGVPSRRRKEQTGFVLAEAVATVVIVALCIVGFAEGLFDALRASQRAASFYVAAGAIENKFASLNMRDGSQAADSGDVEIKQQKWQGRAAGLPDGLRETTMEFVSRGKNSEAVLSIVTLQPDRHLAEEKIP